MPPGVGAAAVDGKSFCQGSGQAEAASGCFFLCQAGVGLTAGGLFFFVDGEELGVCGLPAEGSELLAVRL